MTLLICSYFLADLTSILIEKIIPEAPPSRPVRIGESQKKTQTIDHYGPIFARNLFNSQGLIPGENVTPSGQVDLNSAPVKTTLPLNLIGTLILKDEIKSIATVEDKAQAIVYPVRVDDEIPSKIKILKIESRKVTFLNISSGRREFVDLPEEQLAINPRISLGTQKSSGPGIEMLAPNQYNVSRAKVDKALSNLNEIFTQARCVPNTENGILTGYKCFQIVPGSIYDELGMKDGDMIQGINGQNLSDPAQAIQQLTGLKESNHIDLKLKRNGQVLNYSYDIR